MREKLLLGSRGVVFHGDCRDRLQLLDDNSIDSIVCDPPYEINFMSRKWDRTGIAYNVDMWKECLRVLKPGAYLLAFGGPRTYHRIACAIEDARFEIRDSIHWIQGQGFPKNLDIGKAIDKKAKAKREVIGSKIGKGGENLNQLSRIEGKDSPDAKGCGAYGQGAKQTNIEIPITAPSTPEAKKWDGYGSSLKPSHEGIVLARKPLGERTVVDNVLKWGVGGINIDACRIATLPRLTGTKRDHAVSGVTGIYGYDRRINRHQSYDAKQIANSVGRWPANFVLSHHPDCKVVGTTVEEGYTINRFTEGAKPWGNAKGCGFESEKMPDRQIEIFECVDGCPVKELDKQSGSRKIGKVSKIGQSTTYDIYGNYPRGRSSVYHGSVDGASRFFPVFKYCAKASKRDRNYGCKENRHQTVKPLELIKWLVRLVTPEGGVVLDPFLGSGTTGMASLQQGFRFVGIEAEREWFELASERINYWRQDGKG